jgi:hypothetical protein
MLISNKDSFIDGLKLRMGSNASNLTEDGFEVGADMAMSELGWSYPLGHPLKVFWAYQRGVRHSVHILLIESAHKFRYKEIFLQNRYAHYRSIIDDMDKDFELAKEENPALFVDSMYIDENTLASSLSYYIPNYGDFDTLGRIK